MKPKLSAVAVRQAHQDAKRLLADGIDPLDQNQRLPLMVLAVQERIGGVSRTIIYEWVKKGHFPKPIKIGGRAIAWRFSDRGSLDPNQF